MILLCGVPTEPPLRRVWERAAELGCPTLMFNQRRIQDMDLDAEAGTLRLGGRRHDLADMDGIFLRCMDHRHLPELAALPEDSPLHVHANTLHGALTQWCNVAPGRVLNRPRSMLSNGSKPYQAQLILRAGLCVPETLVTNEPEAARAFIAEKGDVIYKSASGERSIVRLIAPSDLDRLERIRWCPTQFQAYVPGTDVRVHVVGDDVHATRIDSDATDYRYAAREGKEIAMQATLLPEPVRESCIRLARALDLGLAGIDLRRTPDDEWVCFEVNPSPAFTFYEAWTGQNISLSVARYLAHG